MIKIKTNKKLKPKRTSDMGWGYSLYPVGHQASYWGSRPADRASFNAPLEG